MVSQINITPEKTVQEVTLAVEESTGDILLTVEEAVQDVSLTLEDSVTVVVPSAFADKVEKRGFGLLFNTLYTEQSPLSFVAGVPKKLPLDWDGQAANVTAELPIGYESWYLGDTFKGGRVGNDFVFDFFFDYVQDSAKTTGKVILNLGAFSYTIAVFQLQGEVGIRDSGQFSFRVFVSQTLFDNTATVELELDDNVDIFDIRHSPRLRYYGRGN